MGYGLSVFRLSEQILAGVYGKNDQALLGEALDTLEKQLSDYDAQMRAPDLEMYDVDISHADALREIFAGKFTKGVSGSRYGWAFETLCGFLGERLDNSGFIPCKVSWYGELDRVLATHHVPLRFADLIYRSPIPIPAADDWPCVGHWAGRDLAAAGPLASMVTRMENAELKQALESALGWIGAASRVPASVIVGFHG